MERSSSTKQTQRSVVLSDTVENPCWGWLEPSSVLLPYVSLKNKGSAIGRGKEAFEEHVRSSERSSWTGNIIFGREKTVDLYKGVDFIEVADGRVSRMHCVVIQKKVGNQLIPILEDCSTNGTFLNGTKLSPGHSVALKDHDKISLVMSVAPMSEKYYIFHKGSPREQEVEKFLNKTNPEDETVDEANSSSHRRLSKWPTCKYTTADRCTLEDFQCQICLNTLASCVTIEPCGHNFCAACLSNYFATALDSGAQLLCPLRCPEPERVIKNTTVRDLVSKKRKETKKTRSATNDSVFEDESIAMSATCPLFDDQLPLETKNLKKRQVEVTLQKLMAEESTVNDKSHSLEVLARLCWSDDNSRKCVSDASGISLIKTIMENIVDDEAIQCNGCLALMALIRGEGSICQWNQWEIGRIGVVEIIAKAMRKFSSNPMVQLSAMLCFIPLALENPIMQAHLSQAVLGDILNALDLHLNEPDVQCKGLVVLGILAQGEDTLHDAICMRQIEFGSHQRIIAALERYGSVNEDVFWGALFALTTLAREGSPRYRSVCRLLSKSGILKLIVSILKSYEERMQEIHQAPDEAILAAGQYLVVAISEAGQAYRDMWKAFCLSSIGLGILVGSVCTFAIIKRRHGL